MNVHVHTMYEIYQIAFLTLRGWEPSGNQWKKQGHVRNKKCSHPCGCCKYYKETELFDTDDAYDEEFYDG